MKEKELLNCLCNEFNYRLFAGMPYIGFKKLYDSMDSNIMHYIPTAKENIAVGIISGARLAGVNGVVLINASKICNIVDWLLSFNFVYKVPILILAYDNYYNLDKLLPLYNIDFKHLSEDGFKDDIECVTEKMMDISVPIVGVVS